MSDNTGLLNITGQLVTAPSKAFEALQKSGKQWFPLLIIILVSAGMSFYYFSSVDFTWYAEHLTEIQGNDVSPAQKEQAINAYESIGKNVLMYGSIGALAIFIPIMFCIFAVYFLIVSNIRNDNLTFGQCFTIACWSNLVGILSSLIAIVHIAIADSNQIPQSYQKGLNINDLLLGLSPGDDWYNFAINFDLSMIWVAFVAGVGYQVLTKSSKGAGLFISFLPIVAIYGTWVIINLL